MDYLTKSASWLESIRESLSERDNRLITRSISCLFGNLVENAGGRLSKRRLIIPSQGTYVGVWNWDSAFHSIGVMRFDSKLAYEQCAIFLEGQDERGMFMDAYLANGKIFDTITKPPVLAWALQRLYEIDSMAFDVRFVYEKLVKNENFWCKYRKKDEFFHYDSFADDEYYIRGTKNESGWDTSVRWDNGAENIWAIDLNCYMILTYRALRYFAEILGEDVEQWKNKEEELAEGIRTKLWDEEKGAFFDYDYRANRFSTVYSPAQFMPLFVGIATKEQAEKMSLHAQNPDKFYPLLPTVSYDNTKYNSEDYWRGPTWLNVAYFAIKGLKNYGFTELAVEYQQRLLDMCNKETTGIYEYYDSKTGKGLGAKQFGWSAVFIIELILNM